MAVIYFIDSKSDDTHTATFTASFVSNAKPYLVDSTTKTTPLKRLFLDAVNKVTVIAYHGMVFLLVPFKLTFELRVSVNDNIHDLLLFQFRKEILCPASYMGVVCSSLTHIGNALTHNAS